MFGASTLPQFFLVSTPCPTTVLELFHLVSDPPLEGSSMIDFVLHSPVEPAPNRKVLSSSDHPNQFLLPLFSAVDTIVRGCSTRNTLSG